ncbi:two-component system, chemotaxis family, response regulator CheB [Natronoarchaeum philippinense]|uniref:Protein-glutamate methylesterase/protein-glutamine glutaminase n=1 Tax=Natronoarchaeum philippinense TaxID=558529 RepID=A0A285NVF4_NATPI|nr:chemotaxis-specific protein-glutamate methyltransferase CheB [Natronoarchaeum philippinense]SNZ13445.1 two-component system, chemotaxis family, response regulator CheB [Natronoarchaeum philippinense]
MTSVLVVDDSQFMRTVIGNILAENGYDVHRASDGQRAVAAVQKHDPDIVTMDVQMPEMDGIEAVSRIMSTNPTRIIMLSAHTQEGAEETLEALSRGAVDFLAKPSGEVSTDIAGLKDRLLDVVETVARADVSSLAPSRAAAAAHTATAGSAGSTANSRSGPAVSEPRTDAGANAASRSDAPTGESDAPAGSFREHPTVVVGASTGGPKIVEGILYELPRDLDARVLVVQHMPAEFTDRLAARLDELCEYDVREAEDGDRVSGGEVLIARGDRHMEVAHATGDRLRVRLTEDERVHGVRPAIDVTMESAAERVDPPLVGVALTGMGRDGAAGISAIKAAGGTTIAQDEATSPVFGIPRQAIATGDVDHVLPADEIPGGIATALSTEVETHG